MSSSEKIKTIRFFDTDDSFQVPEPKPMKRLNIEREWYARDLRERIQSLVGDSIQGGQFSLSEGIRSLHAGQRLGRVERVHTHPPLSFVDALRPALEEWRAALEKADKMLQWERKGFTREQATLIVDEVDKIVSDKLIEYESNRKTS